MEADGNYSVIRLKTGLGAGMTVLTGDSIHRDSSFADVEIRQTVGHAVDKRL